MWRSKIEPDGSAATRGPGGTVTSRRARGGYCFDPVRFPLAGIDCAADLGGRRRLGGAGYWDYATRTDTAPGQDMMDASGNNANYYTAPYAYPIDSLHYTTVVGEFQNSASAYGTFDQSGNVYEWVDACIFNGCRGLLGGSFGGSYGNLVSRFVGGDYPTSKRYDYGFRVVQSVEPIPGDVDGDGHVDATDLLILAGSWGKSTGQSGFGGRCDFNNDGSVNVVDLLILADNWGT